LFRTVEIRKYSKHLYAKDSHHSDVKNSEMIDSVQLVKFDI
jgi:hypothetical protein